MKIFKFFKDCKKYLASEDIFLTIFPSVIISTASCVIPLLLGLNGFSFLAIPSVVFVGSLLVFISLFIKSGKKTEEEMIEDLNVLYDIIDNNQMKYGNEIVSITHEIGRGHITYHFTDDRKNKLLKLTYDFEEDKFIDNHIHYHLTYFYPEETEDVVEKLKGEIRNSHLYGVPKHKEISVEIFEDDITKAINTLRELSIGLLNDNDMLSLEEKHLVKETIPTELAQLKNLYLSFSDERKVSNQDKVKISLAEIKSAIDTLREKVESHKDMSLEKIQLRIREKITKRL